jgi:hypothetical protein
VLKKLFIAFVLLAGIALAQSTTVTLQVTDTPDNQAWNNGTWQVALMPQSGPSQSYFIIGTTTPVPNQNQSGVLNGTGGASLTLTPNASIAPAQSIWGFTVCPQATSSCFFQQVIIAGATQTVTLTPASIRINLTGIPYRVLAYADAEIASPALGAIYYSVTANAYRVWNGMIWGGISGTSTFGNLGSGTNSSAAMVVGTGASLSTSGSGTIAATSVPWSGVNAATSTVANTEGAGGSLSPSNLNGQIIGTQSWWSVGVPAPTITCTSTGGSLIGTHGFLVELTFVSALGETLHGPSVTYVPNANGCGSGTAVTFTVTAPTLLSGYTGYTVYFCDPNNNPGCTPFKQVSSPACVNISGSCGPITTVLTSGSNPPATNTAYISPAPVGTNICPPGVTPTVYSFDGTSFFPYMGVDSSNTGANPPAPYNKLSFCRPVWFNNTGQDPPSGRNSDVLVFHLQNGTVTNVANQDRGMFIYTTNCVPTSTCSDAGSHYGMAGIQVEQDLNGTPSITGSPDAEVTAVSGQLADYHTTNLTSPNQYGIGAGRFTYFREPNAGSWTGSSTPMTGIRAIAQNNSTVNAASAFMIGVLGVCLEQSGSPSAINCSSFYAQGGGFTNSFGYHSDDMGSSANAWDLDIQAANENQGKNAFAGDSYFSHISAGNLSNRIAFTIPTCSFASGGGTSPSCLVRTGSSDSLGRFVLTTGTGAPAGTGTATLTFHTTFGSPNTDVSCNFTAQNDAGTWQGLVGLVITAHSTTAVTVQWTNGTTPTALATSTTYDINYQCWGN